MTANDMPELIQLAPSPTPELREARMALDHAEDHLANCICPVDIAAAEVERNRAFARVRDLEAQAVKEGSK